MYNHLHNYTMYVQQLEVSNGLYRAGMIYLFSCLLYFVSCLFDKNLDSTRLIGPTHSFLVPCYEFICMNEFIFKKSKII